MATSARWKVALNQQGEAYLYTNLREDPGERANLAGNPLGSGTEREFRALILAKLLQSQLMDDWF